MSLAPRRRRFTSARLSRHDGPATAPHARSRLSVRAASPLGVQLRGRKPPLPVTLGGRSGRPLLGHLRARRRGADGYSSCNGTSASASLAPTSCVKCRAWRRAGTRPPGRVEGEIGDLASRRRDRGPAPRVRGRRSQCWPSRATHGSILSRFVVAELRRQASQQRAPVTG